MKSDKQLLRLHKKALAQSRSNYEELLKHNQELINLNHIQQVIIYRLKRGLRELLES